MNKMYSKILMVLVFGFVSILHSQVTTYSFTTAGIVGQNGPTQAQINAAYLNTNLNGSVTVLSGSLAGIQQFTIPVTGPYRIVAAGSAAGPGVGLVTYSNGCRGRIVQGDVFLTAGTVLKILVGQRGSTAYTSTGGGGGSFVSTITNSCLIVGGGGGGYCTLLSSPTPSSDANFSTFGNDYTGSGGGGTGGTNGAGGNGGSQWGGGGGGFIGNGTAGTACGGTGGTSFINGGLGAGTCYSSWGGFGGGGGTHGNTGGGGGGGGYSGGGGSGQTPSNSAGGGGGSFISPNFTAPTDLGFNVNDGFVLITRLCSITLNSSAPNGLGALCTGQSVTLTTNAVSGISWSTGGTGTSVVVSPSVTTTYSVTGTSTANCLATSIIQLTVNSSVPSLTVSTTGNNICLGQAVSLTGSGALTYTWINAGVTQGNAFTPSVTTTYTLLGQNGCGTSTALTTVTVAPLQVAAISSNSIVCASNTASLTCAAAATGFTWQPVGTTGANIVVSPTANTIYTVTASNGTCLGSATVAVNTNPNPTISIAASGSVACQGSAITMTASGGITYTWYPGASNGATYTAMPTAPTLYSVAGTNSFGCTTWANQVVLTNSSPTISISASNTLVCGGTNVTLTASGASSYSWNTGATTAGINDTPQGTTVYTVQGTANGCASSNTIQVSVFNPVLSISGPTSVCRGQTASLTASAADSYTWSNGSPFAGVVVTPTVSTVYSVAALTSTGNLTCPSSASVNVVVNPLPTVTAVASKTSVCRGQSFTLTASGATTYSWNTGATTASLVTSSTLVANINYTVQGTDANGCTNTSVITIKVNSCIGINELNTAQITVYPNPSKGIFELRDITEVMHIEVYTITGQRILSQSSTESTRLDLSQQPKGIYLLKLSQNGTEAAQYKLIRD